ncbi:MAG: signal peptidase I [Saprospiraceae bacterium]
MSVLLFLIFSYILLSATLYKVFQKAGVDGWKALVPGLNFMEWCKIIGRPAWWALLLLIPIVNIFIFVGMCVDMVRSFGKYDLKDSALAVIYAPLAFFLIGKNEEDKYLGPTITAESAYAQKLKEAHEAGNAREVKKLEFNSPYKKSEAREWVESIVFAVFAAAFIRMFLIEAFVIPTPSMEGSLLVGDFLFVSKAHYGIRTPMTVAQFPLLDNTTPFIGTESYLKKPSLGYHRLPAITNIKRNDPIVFNYPEGDSVYLTPQRSVSVYDARRNPGYRRMIAGKTLRVRPIDKRDHYIKRCIAMPGDEMEIKDQKVFINGKPAEAPTHVQFSYYVTIKDPGNSTFNTMLDNKLDEIGVNLNEINQGSGQGKRIYHLDDIQVAELKKLGDQMIIEPSKYTAPPQMLFPHDPGNFGNWTVDNYGPIKVPQAGETVVITPNNIAMYKRIITVYENNDMSIKNGRIFINGEQVTNYTFKQNYYWAMGDNRHNSEDSRFWGFVPHDHMVGKPLFIWFSTRNGSIFNGINWSRIFSSANKM